MKFLNAIGISAFQLISCLFVLGYLIGILNNYFSDRNNYCKMTYMYEYPQFVRISVEENNKYPQYGLYAYSEGRFTERARKMWFDGIPVLFLPGNSGSHMQVRSIASVALRKELSQGYHYHFDYFTISYNEELSGLYGSVLESQTQFASACITKILGLYKNNKYTKSVPTTVILIGHSMGGLIAKRLLAYPNTINFVNIAITLASPLEAPAINFDSAINNYYKRINLEWEINLYRDDDVKRKKFLISIGSGPRDVLIQAGLTSSNDSHMSALATSIPGVWVTPDHVSMVWCKQLVMVLNRFLFSIVDPDNQQVTEDRSVLISKANQYFQANRSMTLDPLIKRKNVTMQADTFWYEDNRRIYQISRPEIDKTTHLMIRLVSFPQNRFLAIESINVQNKDWIFGCNAKNVYNNYRYCKEATSIGELSRWSGAVPEFGKRKLATVHLHNLMESQPDWTHVIVQVSPTKKPVTLNIDINDHASREIDVKLPAFFSLGKQIIKAETEANSLYYELVLTDLSVIHQAYLLYVEPTGNCQATSYHVTAELHVPWARNHEYHHYFTRVERFLGEQESWNFEEWWSLPNAFHELYYILCAILHRHYQGLMKHVKRSPMKLRLFKSNPNITLGLDTTQKAKVILLLDPKCTFSISISTSWYYRLGQLCRNYTPVLVPYVAAILLLAARSNILHLKEQGTCVSIHRALMSEGVKPYYALVFGRLGSMALLSVPLFSFLFENASWNNLELQYFTRSLLVLPVYMTALGILNIAAAAVLIVMVFSSQIAHRLLFRIVWRGGTSLAEKMAAGLQKVPMVVSGALVCAVPLSCGAASLAAGAAFYAFLLSKMYEEYLEDYVYMLMSKMASKVCRLFKPKKDCTKTSLEKDVTSNEISTSENSNDNLTTPDATNENIDNALSEMKATTSETSDDAKALVSKEQEKSKSNCVSKNPINDIDEAFNSINFHSMLFFLWMAVTIVNIPALLTWARNFKYSMDLKHDTSCHTGFVMSICSTAIWQINGPRKNLKHYESVSALLFTMAVFIIALGPFSLSIVNYGVTFMFTIITVQQLFDTEDPALENVTNDPVIVSDDTKSCSSNEAKAKESTDNSSLKNEDKHNSDSETNEDVKKETLNECNEDVKDETLNECNVCDENRIYTLFRNLREKFTFDT